MNEYFTGDSYNEDFLKAYCDALDRQLINLERTEVPECVREAFKERC
jgi:hypothetical protein